MSLEKAIELSNEGRLSEAEEVYWSEIDAGNSEAQLHMARAFMEAGLKSLALTNYLELKGTPHWELAALQVCNILLGVHKYLEAREALKGLRGELKKQQVSAIEAMEKYTKSYAGDIPELVEHWLLEEDRLLELQAQNFKLETQLELVQAREYLAHYSTVLNSGVMTSVAVTSIVVNAGGAGLPQTLGQAVGSPAWRWFSAAHAASIAFTVLHERQPLEVEEFNKLVLRAQSFIENKYVLSELEVTEDGDELNLLNNLTWALRKMGSPSKEFYLHLFP